MTSTGWPDDPAAAGCPEHRIDEPFHQVGIELRSGAPSQLGEGLLGGPALAIDAVRDHRVVRIRDRQDPRPHGNVAAHRQSGVARLAAEERVVVAHDVRQLDAVE